MSLATLEVTPVRIIVRPFANFVDCGSIFCNGRSTLVFDWILIVCKPLNAEFHYFTIYGLAKRVSMFGTTDGNISHFTFLYRIQLRYWGW